MADFSQAIAVATITDLKALPAVNGQIRKVTQLNATYAYPDSYYIFRSGVAYTERLPGIVADDAATGYWVMFPQPLILSTGDATGTADLPGILWVNTTTGDRFISNPDLSWSAVAGSNGGSTTTTTTGYTQPAVDSNVTVNVGDSSIFAVGQYVYVTDGGNYKVISKPGATQLELQNTGATGNAAPAASIATGKLVTPSGAFGDGTLSGTGAATHVGVWQTSNNVGGDADLTFDSSTDTLDVAESGTYAVGGVAIIDDAAGTTTLRNIDALDATTLAVVRAAVDDGLTVAYHATNPLTAVARTLYLLDTNSTAITVTLPTAPANGTVIAFADYNGNFATNSVNIVRGGTDTIGDAVSTSYALDTDNQAVKLVYWNGIWAIAQSTSAGGGGGSTNLGYTASPTDGTVTSDTGTNATLPLANGTNAGLMAPADFTKLGGIETGADVTDTANVTAAGALMDSEVSSLSGVKTLTVPDNTTISTFGATLTDDADASTARTTLGLGTAAVEDVGTAIGDVVQIVDVGGAVAGLPAIDGSQLTNLPSGFADPMTAAGDIIIRNSGNTTTRLGIGSEGQVLTVSSGVPAWAASAGGGGGLSLAYHNTSTLSPTDQTVYQLDTGSTAITVTLPSAPANGTWYGFCDYDGTFGTNNVTINCSGTDTIINGTDTSVTLDSNFANLWIAYHGGNWSVISAESFVDAGGGSSTDGIQTLSTGGTQTMDNATYNAFSITVSTNTTLAHSGVPATGRYAFELYINWTAGTMTWPSSWTKGNSAPSAPGEYLITGITYDGGTNFIIGVQYL